MKTYTLREFLCANTLILMHRMFPDETAKWKLGNLWRSADEGIAREGGTLAGHSLDDEATWTEWEGRLGQSST